jgi:Cytochrome P460
MMRRIVLLLAAVVVGALALYRTHGDSPSLGAAQFTSDGKLVRPEGYRRWIYVSTGFGMSYSPEEHNHTPKFTNGFVNPSSYDYFVANGKWPDKTIFVLEEYDSSSKGSINQHGSYQQSLAGLVAEVKDESRFKQKWAYFTFSPTSKSAEAVSPAKNDCWQCHEDHAAVEHSFVQFYPELLKIAKEKKTLKPSVKLD